MTKNHVGALIGPTRGFGLGFGVLHDTENDPSPANNGQIYWGGFFKTHFFIDPKADLIAFDYDSKNPQHKRIYYCTKSFCLWGFRKIKP